jgi:hypothetical protein
LTSASFNLAESAGMPKDKLKNIEVIKDLALPRPEIEARLKALLGDEMYGKNGAQLIRYAQLQREKRYELIEVGSYASLSFGALLLLIAAAYLPQLTSLKVPGLQLEKGSAERAESKATLSISR